MMLSLASRRVTAATTRFTVSNSTRRALHTSVPALGGGNYIPNYPKFKFGKYGTNATPDFTANLDGQERMYGQDVKDQSPHDVLWTQYGFIAWFY